MVNNSAAVAQRVAHLATLAIEVDEARTRVRAKELWWALTALDSKLERAELAAANVPTQAIEALYPYAFEDLTAGLTAIFRQPRPDGELARWNENFWGDHHDSVQALSKMLPPGERLQFEHGSYDFMRSEAYKYLLPHLQGSLLGSLKETKASAMLTCLRDVHWHMANLSVTGIAPHEVHRRLVEIINWVLPHLEVEVAKLTQ